MSELSRIASMTNRPVRGYLMTPLDVVIAVLLAIGLAVGIYYLVDFFVTG